MRRRRVAIVGHEAAKFTSRTEEMAKYIIRNLIEGRATIVVSGGCHLGGVDIWAEEIADELGIEKHIYKPERLTWKPLDGSIGFEHRNGQIASDCDEAHCIVVRDLPSHFEGRRHTYCYHCGDMRPPHIKSGGCWTVVRAGRRHVPTEWHII